MEASVCVRMRSPIGILCKQCKSVRRSRREAQSIRYRLRRSHYELHDTYGHTHLGIAVCGSGIAYIALVYSSRRCIHIPSIHSFVRSFVRYSHDFSCCLISNFYLFLVSSPFFSLHYLLYDMAKCLRASRLHTLHIYRARITAASNLKKKGDDDDEDEARTEKQK